MDNKFDYSTADLTVFDQMIRKYGWLVYENALENNFADQICEDLKSAYQLRRKIQINNGIADQMKGTLHHLIDKESFSLRFLEQQYCSKQIRHFLGGNFIINSLGAVINTKGANPYVQNIHRDLRSFTGDFKVMIQMIVTLDDFSIDNGATYFLSGSHQTDVKPDEEYFYKNASRATTKKGSLILFDSNLWHAAGKNEMNEPRRALTMAFTRPFMKQQLDYPRMLGYEFKEQINSGLSQVLGYNSRVPADLQEYYQPVENRMYKSDQG